MKQVDTLAEYQKLCSSHSLVVFDFYATWCGPCKAIAPFIETLETHYPTVVFAKVNSCLFKIDVDKSPEIAQSEGVTSMPTFIFYKKTKLNTITGANRSAIEAIIKQHAKPSTFSGKGYVIFYLF